MLLLLVITAVGTLKKCSKFSERYKCFEIFAIPIMDCNNNCIANDINFANDIIAIQIMTNFKAEFNYGNRKLLEIKLILHPFKICPINSLINAFIIDVIFMF